MEAAWGCADLSKEHISDDIYRDFMEDKKINYAHIETYGDGIVCNLCFIFDVNFDNVLKRIYDEKYLEKIVERANFQDPETFERVHNMLNLANDYMEKRLNLK